MAFVQQLRPIVPLRPATPRCEAQRRGRYANDPPGQPLPQCEHSSSYVVEGRHLCKPHAGVRALEILLEQSAAKFTEASGK